MKSTSAIILILLIGCGNPSSVNETRSFTMNIMDGIRFKPISPSSRWKQVSARTRTQCLSACFQSNICQTINYFFGEHKCDLYLESIDQGQTELDESVQTIFCVNQKLGENAL
jgi:hypothetical protein